jgi:hypothetical protein
MISRWKKAVTRAQLNKHRASPTGEQAPWDAIDRSFQSSADTQESVSRLLQATLHHAFYQEDLGSMVLHTSAGVFTLAVPHQHTCEQVVAMLQIEQGCAYIIENDPPRLLIRTPSWGYSVVFNAVNHMPAE